MWRSCGFVLALLFVGVIRSFGCWCGPPGPASEYVEGASVVFVGKAVFSDDDGSDRFTQKTLVRFEVEEAYKGLEQQPHDVWVDPGSFTSCYATYASVTDTLSLGTRGRLRRETLCRCRLPEGSPTPNQFPSV